MYISVRLFYNTSGFIIDYIMISKRYIIAELKGALQQVKDHMDGKIQLKSAEALLDELRVCSL